MTEVPKVESESHRTRRLHAGHQFGDVVVNEAGDSEPTWLFNDSVTEARYPSLLATVFHDHRPNTGLDDRHFVTLDALYTAVAVVESLVVVKNEYLDARSEWRTSATNASAWLEELVARCDKRRGQWRRAAFRACEEALAAYQQTRFHEASVVPPEEQR